MNPFFALRSLTSYIKQSVSKSQENMLHQIEKYCLKKYEAFLWDIKVCYLLKMEPLEIKLDFNNAGGFYPRP